MTHKDELAELKARVAELERAAKPPEPYIDDWVPPPRPIDRVSMPMSAMRELAQAVPDSVLRGIVRDNRCPPGRPGVIPSQHDVRPGGGALPANTTGWREAAPLGPQPGINHVDRIMLEADRRDRLQAMEEEARRQALLEEKP